MCRLVGLIVGIIDEFGTSINRMQSWVKLLGGLLFDGEPHWMCHHVLRNTGSSSWLSCKIGFKEAETRNSGYYLFDRDSRTQM